MNINDITFIQMPMFFEESITVSYMMCVISYFLHYVVKTNVMTLVYVKYQHGGLFYLLSIDLISPKI